MISPRAIRKDIYCVSKTHIWQDVLRALKPIDLLGVVSEPPRTNPVTAFFLLRYLLFRTLLRAAIANTRTTSLLPVVFP